MVLSNYLISVTSFSSCPQSFPALWSFPMSQLFALANQSIEASATVLPMNIQSWFPLGLTGLITLLSKGISRVCSSTTVQKHHSLALILLYGQTLTSVHITGKTIALTIQTFVGKVMSVFFNMLSRFIMEKAMAPHSSTLAWKIPWMEEPGGLQSMGSRLSNFTFTFHFHALEKEMATHSSVPAWRIPGMAEPDGLQSMGSHEVGHDWSDLAAVAAAEWRKPN